MAGMGQGWGSASEKHEHELPGGLREARRGCDHDNQKLGHVVRCTYPKCNLVLGRVCGGCGDVY